MSLGVRFFFTETSSLNRTMQPRSLMTSHVIPTLLTGWYSFSKNNSVYLKMIWNHHILRCFPKTGGISEYPKLSSKFLRKPPWWSHYFWIPIIQWSSSVWAQYPLNFKHTSETMENHHFSWVNQRSKWPMASQTGTVYQRVTHWGIINK